MYERHFGLKEKPFSITPDADFLFLSNQHSAGLAMLEYGVFEQAGVTVITGDVGAGKTTLIRHLLGTIPYDELSVGLISNVHSSLGSLLQWIAVALDLYIGEEELSNIQIFRRLQTYLINEYAAGRRVVIVIDEAQNMNGVNLEEIRMLLNINADKNQLLQIVLVGQPELLQLLQEPKMSQLAQRVTAEYHLTPLSLEDTKAYINSRLKSAGYEGKGLFDKTAIEVIFYYSGGIPRLINTLSDHSLIVGYGMNSKRITVDVTLEAVQQKRIGGIQHHTPRTPEAGCVKKALLEKTGFDLDALSYNN